MNEHAKIITVKYTDAHIISDGQEIPLEVAELVEKTRLCDENCNECPIVGYHQNNRQLTLMLNRANDLFGNAFYQLINKQCTNLTVCAECRVDDFVHVENCSILKILEADSHSSNTRANGEVET